MKSLLGFDTTKKVVFTTTLALVGLTVLALTTSWSPLSSYDAQVPLECFGEGRLAPPQPRQEACACNTSSGQLSTGAEGLEVVKEVLQQPIFEVLPPANADLWEGRASRRHGLNPGKFIIPGILNEQLSKCARHLSEILVLARALNRTFVLPDVSHSQFGMDRNLPFSTYFDTAKLGEYVDWVTWEQFVLDTRGSRNPGVTFTTAADFMLDVRSREFFDVWDVERQRPKTTPPSDFDWLEDQVRETEVQLGPNKPSGGVLVLKSPGGFCGTRVQPYLWERFNYFSDTSSVQCLDLPQHVLNPGEKLWGPAQEVLGETARALNRRMGWVDVVYVVKNRQYDLFLPRSAVNQANRYLVSSPQIKQNVTRIQEHLGERHVAIQWRMEKCLEKDECNREALMRCARGLVADAKQRLATLNATRVFFASDAPTSTGLRSTSYWNLKDPEERMKAASDAAQYVANNLDVVTWSDFEPSILGLDFGVQALLDKEVCVGATEFVTAPPVCSSTFSEYVLVIKEGRQERGMGFDTWAMDGVS